MEEFNNSLKEANILLFGSDHKRKELAKVFLIMMDDYMSIFNKKDYVCYISYSTYEKRFKRFLTNDSPKTVLKKQKKRKNFIENITMEYLKKLISSLEYRIKERISKLKDNKEVYDKYVYHNDCSNCGAKCLIEADYCSKCGKSLKIDNKGKITVEKIDYKVNVALMKKIENLRKDIQIKDDKIIEDSGRITFLKELEFKYDNLIEANRKILKELDSIRSTNVDLSLKFKNRPTREKYDKLLHSYQRIRLAIKNEGEYQCTNCENSGKCGESVLSKPGLTCGNNSFYRWEPTLTYLRSLFKKKDKQLVRKKAKMVEKDKCVANDYGDIYNGMEYCTGVIPNFVVDGDYLSWS